MNTNDYFMQACEENGMEYGFMPFDPPTAGKVLARYQELMEMDEKNVRNHLVNRFMDLYVGDMPEVWTMPLNYLEGMVDELEEAQADGMLNLATDDGIATLKEIVDRYTN